MSLQTRLDALITAIGADIKALQAASPGGGGTPNVYSTSASNQVISGNSDTKITGAHLNIPQGKIRISTIARFRFNATKTGAGTTAPVINVRCGTAGTTADTSIAQLTFPAQTAVADDGVIQVDVAFRSDGAAAAVHALGTLTHGLSITGLSTKVSPTATNTGLAFDATGANLKMILTLNVGASGNWTLSFVSAELLNLAP